MATLRERARDSRVDRCAAFRAVVAWLILMLLVSLPGCRECRKSPDGLEKEKQQAAEKAKKKKEEEIPPFEAGSPRVLPTSSLFPGTCKPGHWISYAWPDVKANLGDFQGEVQTEIVDRGNRRVKLDGVSYELAERRPAALAKQQPKSLESFAWIPPNAHGVNLNLATRGGTSVVPRSLLLRPLASYQYFFVVLSRGSRFDYLAKRLDSIQLHRSHLDLGEKRSDQLYEVVTLPPDRRPALPTHSLYWTSIAYLLWDDSDSALWDLDQQRAVIDWLHWGGQIIVSGPDALQQLQGSFLRPYLPATVEKSRTLKADDLSELQYWAGPDGRPPRPVRPWPAGVLKKDAHADYLSNTGETIIEKRIGRGRVVVSAFRITGPEFTGWEGCDCFFNACLMRRGPREFQMNSQAGERAIHWMSKPVDVQGLMFERYAASLQNVRDADKNTAIRYFTRDAGVPFDNYALDATRKQPLPEYSSRGPGFDPNPDDAPFAADDENPLQEVGPGLAAWNDYSPAATAARKTVKDAAYIAVPPRTFIVWVVVGYLSVLVPLNWLLFRAIGRVEWAWIAAPLIAIGCTVVVVQQAQLNIGFARARNELVVIEMQPGYARAHMTCYDSLYTSLATGYGFQLNEPGGQILPFPGQDREAEVKRGFGESLGEVVCRRGDETRLTGFHVDSNRRDFVHSEEMADFGGTLALHHDSDGSLRVTNGTKHPLAQCDVLRCDKSSGMESATIDQLDPGKTARLTFHPFKRQPELLAEFLNRGRAQTLSDEGVRLVALHIQEMRPGEVCLIARIADEVPGLMVTPASQQSRQAALLVAHLDAGKLPEPERDVLKRSSNRNGVSPQPGDAESIDTE